MKSILLENIARFKEEFMEALMRAHRSPSEVVPIIVTKWQPISLFPILLEAGFRDFGESRVLEGVNKQEELEKAGYNSCIWHFIGSLQKNKVRKALSSFQVIHSIASLDLAKEIAKRILEMKQAGETYTTSFFLQVNPVEEESKQGFAIDELMAYNGALVQELSSLLGSSISGLMAMAPRKDLYGEKIVHTAFSKVQNLFDYLRSHRVFDMNSFQGLSMGMSQDFEIALQYGATHIRVGNRIFQGIEYKE